MRSTLTLIAMAILAVALSTTVSGRGTPSAAPDAQQSSGSTQKPPAQPPDQQQPQQDNQNGQQPGPPLPTFKAGINFVRVDVIASTSKGEPVLDLKKEDFLVTEDGKPQTVDSFKLINLDQITDTTPPRQIKSLFDEESEAQREDVRLFAIFLDDYHTRRGGAMYVRGQLANFVRTQLRPSDMVALMYPLTPISDVVMSRNFEVIAHAIEQFDGRKYDYTPRNQFEEEYVRYPTETVERIRNQVSLSAIRSLVTHLGSLREGRKAVILVSEGYTNYLPPQLRTPSAAMPGFGTSGAPMGAEAVGNNVEDRTRFFDSAEMIGDLREVYDTANKNNTAIYALDPRGLAAFEHDINEGVGMQTDAAMLRNTQDTLRILADQTDGRAIVDQNDLGKGLRQAVKDTSTYYLLGYNSTQAPQDGKFHEIKVKIKRPGVEARYRKGYWALTTEDTKRMLEPPKPVNHELDQALSTIGSHSTLQPEVVRTWLGLSRGQNGKTRVTFVWEPIPPSLSGPKTETPARVSLQAMGADGTPLYRGRAPDVTVDSAIPLNAAAAAAAAPAPAAAKGPTELVFEVPPGTMQLRMQVENQHANVIDTSTHEYKVPDLTAPQVQLSTPEVLRARTLKEYKDFEANPDAVPTPNREFRRTDRLIIRVDAYAPGGGSPEVTARLLDRAGVAMNDIAVGPGKTTGEHQIDLPLASLAAAEYVIEISAKGESGSAKQMIAFRIVS
jgi:VWFA-related protein